MCFTGDRGLQIGTRRTNGQIRRRIADLREVIEMAMRVTRFAFGRRTKDGGDVVLPLDVRLVREIQIAPVRLRFTGERRLEVVVCLRALQFLHRVSPGNGPLADIRAVTAGDE